MDKISDLPTIQKDLSTSEQQVVNKYFDTPSPQTKKFNWKLFGIIIAAFTVLSLGYVTTVITSTSYFQNVYIAFLVKVVIFAGIVALAMYFL